MKKKGFTIIELMVIIVIIGLLTGISLFSYRSLFASSKLEEMANEIRAFYEGVNKKAVTEGYRYTIYLDRENEFLKYVSTEGSKQGSLVLPEGLNLDFAGGVNPVRLTVYVDGFVKDKDDIRDFSVKNGESGKSLDFYISPLGVLEVKLQ